MSEAADFDHASLVNLDYAMWGSLGQNCVRLRLNKTIPIAVFFIEGEVSHIV